MTPSEPIGDGNDRDARIVDYVLGEMTPAEAASFERAMTADPALSAAVADWRERLLEIDETAPAGPAGDALWRRIESALLAPVARPAAIARPARTFPDWWNSLAFWRLSAFAGAAAALVLAVAIAGLAGRTGIEPVYVAILVPDDGGPPGAIVEIGADEMARLIPLRDIPVPDGRALQVWTLQDKEAGPRSIGLIPRAEQASLTIDTAAPTRTDQLFEITLEPETGSPTGRPTGPILYKGLTVAAR